MKKRIIGATLFTVVCALLISNVVGVLMFRSREMDAARNTLQELLTLMDAQSAITEPEELLRQFSQAAPDKRLTIIDTDGTVLADSEADVSAMEDHEDRPEVMEAEATGWGEAVRQSDTVGTSMLYVAKRFADNMVGRAAMPVSSINSLALGSVGGFTLAAVAALILTLLLASRTANRAAAPLDAVGAALQGVLDGKEPPAGLNPDRAYDELRPLLRTIDKLVERLRGYIQSITAERDKVGLILDCMAEGLILLDDEGNVLAINRAARNRRSQSSSQATISLSRWLVGSSRMSTSAGWRRTVARATRFRWPPERVSTGWVKSAIPNRVSMALASYSSRARVSGEKS